MKKSLSVVKSPRELSEQIASELNTGFNGITSYDSPHIQFSPSYTQQRKLVGKEHYVWGSIKLPGMPKIQLNGAFPERKMLNDEIHRLMNEHPDAKFNLNIGERNRYEWVD